MKKFGEVALLQDQVKALRMHDKLPKHKFHEDTEKLFEPLTQRNIDNSQDETETVTDTSIENNRALLNLNAKLLNILKDRDT